MFWCQGYQSGCPIFLKCWIKRLCKRLLPYWLFLVNTNPLCYDENQLRVYRLGRGDQGGHKNRKYGAYVWSGCSNVCAAARLLPPVGEEKRKTVYSAVCLCGNGKCGLFHAGNLTYAVRCHDGKQDILSWRSIFHVGNAADHHGCLPDSQTEVVGQAPVRNQYSGIPAGSKRRFIWPLLRGGGHWNSQRNDQTGKRLRPATYSVPCVSAVLFCNDGRCHSPVS